MRLAVGVVALGILAGSATAGAQTLTVQGGSSATVAAARDFAATTLTDPWDFNERSDFVYWFSGGWSARPAVSSGVLTGTVSANPSLQLQFEGINGGLNLVGRNGLRFPIDPTQYKRISFRMRRPNRTPHIYDTFEAFWYHETCRVGCSYGSRLALSHGYDTKLGRYVNQSPTSVQANTTYHIYKFDLDGWVEGWTTGNRWEQTGTVRGVAMRLGEGGLAPGTLSGATIEVDWIRLTPRGSSTVSLSWSGFSSAVTLTATNGTDTIQVFPDDGTSATTFASSRTFAWDYGFLPPGTWTVSATDGTRTRQVSVVIVPQTIATLTDPDETGGSDFATTVIGDPWDMANVGDISPRGLLYNVANPVYAANGMTATSAAVGASDGRSWPANVADPAVYLLDDSNKPAGTATAINADVYRHLTFTLEYANKDYQWPAAASAQGVARVIWRRANANGLPLTNSQDILLLDGGTTTLSMDLATFTRIGGNTCYDCYLESDATDLWQGQIATFRIDPLESSVPQGFRLANVRITADDAPDSGRFLIRWNARAANYAASLPSVSNGTVNLYYDTDNSASNGGRVSIASNLALSAGSYSWYMAGVPAGRYWIYIEVTGPEGITSGRYSTGPIRLATAIQDGDTDGLPDAWEVQFGLNPGTATGDDGPTGDPDGDGRTNAEEYADGTHPRGFSTRYFAEGATGTFFDCHLALVNPSATTAASVQLRFLKTDGTVVTRAERVPARARRTVVIKDVAGLGTAEFSTVVESDVAVVADRTMTWDAGGYGSHSETSVAAPQTVWYLAEGATHSGFDLWYLIQNPSLTTDAEVEVTYLRPAPLTPVVKTYRVARSSRFNIWVNQEGAALASTDVSARVAVTNGVPVIVERAMYLSAGGQFWGAGHNSAAVAAPATEWFLAEGATGSYFDLFYLICNPGPTAAVVAVTYLRPAPAVPVTKTYTVAAASRFNIYVDAEEVPAGSGQWPLANVEVSARLVSTNGVPVVVERAMWWPGPTAGTWAEGHNSPGMTASGVEWVVADGEQGGTRQVETYVLMANPTATAASVAVTMVFEDGTAPVTQTFTVGAYSRVTLTPPVHFAAQFPAGTHRRFGVVVTSTGATPVPIVVERASYATPVGGAPWAAGTNAAATRMR